MLVKLRETKANLLKMTDNQLDTTTKRTWASPLISSCEGGSLVVTFTITPSRS